MGRSKPKEFRYQRINFDDDDDEDNSDLARALGPSPGAQRATCAQCVRGFCIVSTILATTAFIATAVLFGSVILPSGTKIFGNTTDLLNHDGNITIGVNDTQVEATQHLNETTTNTTSAEPNLEQNSSMMNETQLETNSTKNPPSENQAQEPSTPTNDHSEDDNDDSSDTDKTDQSEDNDKTHPNSTLTAKADSDSETKVTSRKLLSLSSTEKSENVTTTETVEAPDQASSFQALLERFDRQELVAMVALICFTVVGISISLFGILCFLQRRRRAKRNHFSRLINDLNATEKFTLDVTSDDEEVSD